MRSILRLLACTSLFCLCILAKADPITYTFTGMGSGNIGDPNGSDYQTFSNSLFTLQLATDTSAIMSLGTGLYVTPYLSPTIDIAGVGSATLTGIRAFVYNPSSLLGLQALPSPADIMDISTQGSTPDAFSTYDLSSSLGPIGPINPTSDSIAQFNRIPVSQFNGVSSSTDQLTFNSITMPGITFTAVRNSAGIPESSSLVLLGSMGLLGAALLRRQRAR